MKALGATGRWHLMQVVYSLMLGGPERLACDLALKVDPSRIRSSICALVLGGPLADTLREAAVPFYVADCGPGFQWRVVQRLYRLFREQQVDLVQTHHLKQLAYSGLGARLAGAALVHVEHEYFTLREPRVQRRLRALAPLCHRIVAVGDKIKEVLVQEVGLPAPKIRVIPNGVDMSRYAPRARVAREQIDLPIGDRLIGHVARMEPEKDQETLLRAVRLVFAATADVRLVIVGDGSRRGQLGDIARSLGIADRVHFLGPRAHVADLLPHLDVFALSSLNEGLPLALLEAMACGRPVVATAVGEIPQVVHQGITGLTVPPGDPPALAGALTAILERPQWAADLGRAAHRLVEEQLSLTSVVARYQELYDELFRSNGAPGH